MKNTPATVYIYPMNEEDEPISEWFWEAEIIVDVGTKNIIPKHTFGSTTVSLTSIQSAFDWAYEWLTSNGYDASNLEFEMNDKSHKGIAKNEA
jgi:hypothetical protein